MPLPRRTLLLCAAILGLCWLPCGRSSPGEPDDPLWVGFGERDITPDVKAGPVYLAGFGKDRKATGIHDPLLARAVVLRHGARKIALVSVDLVGYFREEVLKVRRELPGFHYVLVSSTHNHEGPDTLGLWGPNPFKSGVDPKYMETVRARIVEAVRDAERAEHPVTASLCTANAPELLHDGREPYVKHDELVAIQFRQAKTKECAGVIVQWNCHPETLGSKNTLVSADYVWATVAALKKKHLAPVLYLTGTVGGLMTSLHVEVKDEQGRKLEDGTYEKTERYGNLVAALADKALGGAKEVRLTPLEARSREVFIPLDNKAYVAGWQLGVLDRPAYLWKDDPDKAEPLKEKKLPKGRVCVRTEVARLRLGELDIAAIPGEIYPELVLDKVQDPPDKGADFPDAPIEPAIYRQLRGPYRMMIGLANDEIGYIIPKRQWDEKPPYCYGRDRPQYGETNSPGPDTAPILCAAFRKMAESRK
jgi:hypothetical protein